jgi:hypothetical protein
MTVLSTLVVKIVGDISEYATSIQKTQEMTSSFSDKAVSGLSVIGGGVVMGALAAGTAAVFGLSMATWNWAQEAMSAEESQAQLTAVLQSTAGAAGVSAEMANSLANSLAQVTRFEDDAIVSGESMLLTFTNIGSDVFPETTRTMLDMSQALGQDVKSSAMQLGKALNDPINGVTALSRVGVTFTDEQKAMIEQLQKTGDTAGAQRIILAELNKEFGGSAEAAGKTAAGTWERAQNIFKNIQETLGAGLLPAISQLGNVLLNYLNKPETTVFINQLAQGIATFAMNVVTGLPVAITYIQNAFGWLQQNQGVIVAAVAVIGASIAAFVYTTVIPAAIAAITAFAPVLAVIVLIGAAAYLLYTAWTQNWGGIQQKTAAVMTFVQGLIQGGLAAIQAFWTAHGTQIMAVVNSAWQFIQFIFNSGMNIIRSLVLAIQAAMRGDWYAFGEYLRQAVDGWGKMLANIISVGWSAITTAVRTIVTNVINFFKTTDWAAVGTAIVQGIANGITSGISWIKNAALAAANAALEAAKGFLGIQSPSKKMHDEVGVQMAAGTAEGYQEGLDQMMPNTLPSLSKSVSGAASRMSGMARGANAGNGGITVVINLAASALVDEYETARRIGAAVKVVLRQEGLA